MVSAVMSSSNLPTPPETNAQPQYQSQKAPPAKQSSTSSSTSSASKASTSTSTSTASKAKSTTASSVAASTTEPRRVRFSVGSKYSVSLSVLASWKLGRAGCERGHGQPRGASLDQNVQDVIGEGAYGVVCSAIHRPTGQKVAIKVSHFAVTYLLFLLDFEQTPENRSIRSLQYVFFGVAKTLDIPSPRQPADSLALAVFCLRTLRELKLLRYFAEQNVSENIISIIDIIKPTSLENFKEVYLIQELMETDLHRVIRTQNLSDDHAQYFTYQALRAIKALHSADVIHRDLKPSNLLLNANCDLKVCDFGLARSTQTAEPNGGETGFMTEYVATRWYRAPEIMLTFKQYTKAIGWCNPPSSHRDSADLQILPDIWSIGCILAEMLSGRPLFPGHHHQLTLILDVLGTPTLDEFYAISSRRSRDYLRALPFRKKRDFATLFPNASPQAVDFLKCTLTFDPKQRITVEEALAHPYLANYHDPDDEPVAPPLEPSFFDFDLAKDSITREELKKLLFDEVMAFNSLA
ncbi:hypothetical protein P7C70_g6458, partial [Phenoliferia sp. Uapishka_3]